MWGWLFVKTKSVFPGAIYKSLLWEGKKFCESAFREDRAKGALLTNTGATRGADVVRVNPNGFAAHLGRLIAVTKAQPELREDVQTWLAQLDSEAERRQ